MNPVDVNVFNKQPIVTSIKVTDQKSVVVYAMIQLRVLRSVLKAIEFGIRTLVLVNASTNILVQQEQDSIMNPASVKLNLT